MTRSIQLISILLVGILPFSMFGCGEGDDRVSIPDDELRSEIKMALNIPDDTPITPGDMLKLTQLDVESTPALVGLLITLAAGDIPPSISDLTGLEYAENLEVLNLPNSDLVDISPLAELQNLQILSINSTALVDISPLAELQNLTELNIGDNHIVDISLLTRLKNLQKLELKGNPLSDDSKKRIVPIIEANGTEVSY